MESQGTFDEEPAAFAPEPAAFAAELRRLRRERGNPTYRVLKARAANSGTRIRLPIATLSDAFRGKRLLGFDTLMGLVRILYSYDEYGQENPTVPSHASPCWIRGGGGGGTWPRSSRRGRAAPGEPHPRHPQPGHSYPSRPRTSPGRRVRALNSRAPRRCSPWPTGSSVIAMRSSPRCSHPTVCCWHPPMPAGPYGCGTSRRV
ncbi:hypothetical protein WKI68_39035 [Streptomyces sp. MS1.HAVA.3]|uniref:Uncharacterized protein n=1 Tax=Streptomyces caledonius TaxID=3134107 RepID=A0ABU8UE69_9ACTN